MHAVKRVGVVATAALLALGASALPAQAKSDSVGGKGGLCTMKAVSEKPAEGATGQRVGDRPGRPERPGRPDRPQKPERPGKPGGQLSELTGEQKRAINAIIRQFRAACREVENSLRDTQKVLRKEAKDALSPYREAVRELKAAITAAETSGQDTSALKAELKEAAREFKAAQENTAADMRKKTAELRAKAGDQVAALRAEMESAIEQIRNDGAAEEPAPGEDGNDDDTTAPSPDPEVAP